MTEDLKKKQGKAPAFLYSKDQNPHYFGHFINQARHNAFMIMADLARRFEVEEAPEDRLLEAPLLKLLDEKNRPDQTARLLREIMRHFSFLRYLTIDPQTAKPTRDPIPKDVKTVLYTALSLLNSLRNTYSHYGHDLPGLWKISENKPFPLIDIYKGAVNLLKPRYSYYTDEHLDNLWPSEENKNNTPNDPAIEPYNERALLFFTCLFLERDEITRFISRIDGFQSSEALPRRALLDAYREFSCRLPHDKLESSDILLDMFNELGRCPGPLYKVLSEEDRKKFDRTPEADEEGMEQEDMLLSLLIRHNDRFPWFALRYFDDQEIFPSLRFHIHLGKFAEDKYLKKMNQEERERTLLHPIRTFSRWKQVDVTDLRRTLKTMFDEKEKSKLLEARLPGSWLNILPNQNPNVKIYELRPEVDQFSSSYLLDGNCIGFRFVKPGEIQGFPELQTERNEKGRLKMPAQDRQPHAVLSTYELAALFLHQKLFGAENTEVFIQAFIHNSSCIFHAAHCA